MCKKENKLENISGVRIPDSKLAKEVKEFVQDTSTELLFNHSSRVYFFAAIRGRQLGLKYDPELLYTGAMFHDIGLVPEYSSKTERFEVDGANAARDFLMQRGVPTEEADTVWTSIALHTTPGIPCHMHPVIALVTEGVEMDVLGITHSKFSDAERESIVSMYPRTDDFKNDIIQAFYDGIKHKPDTTFGNVKADVLELKDPQFKRGNFCSVILNSAWAA